MFPRELLAVNRRGNRVSPQYAPFDREYLAVVQHLIDTYRAHVGKRKGDLQATLLALEEEAGTRFKLLRGLATLLERRASFEMASRVDPARVRRLVFEAAQEAGPLAGVDPDTRARVLASAAEALGLTSAEVEAALYADLEERLVLVAVEEASPRELLARYNVGLAQTLLFDATRVEVIVGQNAKRLFSALKRNGLMHLAARQPDGRFLITVDGPTALFRHTRRYGSALAKLLPTLLRCGEWELTATLSMRGFNGEPEERIFHLESAFEGIQGAVEEEAPAFDSAAEASFAEAFGALRGGWRLLREPALLHSGESVVIPDFGFAWGGDPAPRVLVELVGYWTPEYLARKVAKMKRLDTQGVRLLLLVDESLGCAADAFEGAPVEVVTYKGSVPLRPVARILDEERAILLAQHLERLASAELPPERDALVVGEASALLDVPPEALRHAGEQGLLKGRELVGDLLLTPEGLARLAARLPQKGTLREMEAALAGCGVADASALLARLGYQVRWNGLDPGNALAVKGAEPSAPSS